MEQQNQQSIQEEKITKPPIKTNWKFIAIVAVLTLLAVGGILLFAYFNKSTGTNPITYAQCSQLEQEIDTLVKRANYCEVDSDCQVSNKVRDYPCGCWSLTNKEADVTEIMNKISQAEATCILDFICEQCEREPNVLSCKNNRCVGVYDTDVSDWQTYRNDEFGFEVKYPRKWTSLKHSSQSVEFHHPDNNPYISLGVFEDIGGSGDESVRGITFCGAYPDQCTHQKFSIDGVQTAIEWRLHDASVNFGIPGKNYVMSISFNSNFEKISSEEMKLFLQILSTFRFTVPVPE